MDVIIERARPFLFRAQAVIVQISMIYGGNRIGNLGYARSIIEIGALPRRRSIVVPTEIVRPVPNIELAEGLDCAKFYATRFRLTNLLCECA